MPSASCAIRSTWVAGPAASRGTSRTRRSIVWPDTRRSTSTCLRSTVASPSASSDPGRSSKTTARSSSIAPRASSETRRSSAAAPSRSRASSVDADSAASATPNSRCVTESCSSRASRLRSSMMFSSRLRSCSRAFSIAIAACAASSSISFWSASEKSGWPSFSVRYSAPITSPRATIGTPRNEHICGCVRGHQPRKRGWRRMSSVR